MRLRGVIFTWTDEGVMKPLGRFMNLCQRQYVIGEEYALGPVEEVLPRERGAIFAETKRAWKNLDHEFDGKFPSLEHLRKWALIEVGYYTQSETVLSTAKDAKNMALQARKLDDYARISVVENVVIIRTAKSISGAALKREEFKIVKKAVIDLLASMANTTAADLSKEAKKDLKENKGHYQ